MNEYANALAECEALRARSEEWFRNYQLTGRIDGRAILAVAQVADLADKSAD